MFNMRDLNSRTNVLQGTHDLFILTDSIIGHIYARSSQKQNSFNLYHTVFTKKGHTHSNKPAPFSCRFVYVCLIFLWIPEMKGLKITNENPFPVQENGHRHFKILKKINLTSCSSLVTILQNQFCITTRKLILKFKRFFKNDILAH